MENTPKNDPVFMFLCVHQLHPPPPPPPPFHILFFCLFRDVYLLLTLWEALFFSASYEHKTQAEKLLEELPQLGKLDQVQFTVKSINFEYC